MTKPPKLGAFAILLTFMLAACSRSTGPSVTVHSLRGSLAELTRVGQAWRTDAYLETAGVRLIGESTPSYLISAKFNSPSDEFESIAVRLLPDGSISTKTYEQSVSVIQTDPINDDDWQLDSPEALLAALDDEGIQFLETLDGTFCSSMFLERLNLAPGSPVVWRVLISECESPLTGQTTVIDATTGELISRESHLP